MNNHVHLHAISHDLFRKEQLENITSYDFHQFKLSSYSHTEWCLNLTYNYLSTFNIVTRPIKHNKLIIELRFLKAG